MMQISDLPQGWRYQEALDVIGQAAQRVVMIYIPRMSSERPTSIFSECPHFGGTGFAYYVDHNIVKVRTNLHVIYNADEAAMATVQFSLHVPYKRHVRVIRLQASGHYFYNNLCEDYASFTCFTTQRLRKFLHLFCDVPVLWDASFFLDNSDSGTDSENEAGDGDNGEYPVMSSLGDRFKRSQSRGGDCNVRGISLQKYPGETVSCGNHFCETALGEQCRQTLAGMSDSLMVEYDVSESLETSRLSEAEAGVESHSQSDSEEMDHVYNVDSPSSVSSRHCRRPTLENGDYVAILSHPQGQDKCFSMGLAALYDPETLEKQRMNFRNLKRMARTGGHSHAGHPAVHLINDRFKICKNRIYHTQSTFGCSGAPVLLFKRSLQRMKIPVVDYSQHSGTCFFKNGEKLGFATCFTPPVFSQSAQAYEDLQQCYSVIRKQEQMLRLRGKLQSKRFELPGSAAESTHIVNTDGSRGKLSYHYRTENGSVIRKTTLLRGDRTPSMITPSTSPSQRIVSASPLRLPSQFKSQISKSRDNNEGRTRDEAENNFLKQKSNFGCDKSCPLKELPGTTCDTQTLQDFLSFEDVRGSDDRDIGDTDCSPCWDREMKSDQSLQSMETSALDRHCRHSLEGSFGYRIRRKKPRSSFLPVKSVKEKVKRNIQALKVKKEQKAEASSDKHKRNKLLKTGFRFSTRHSPHEKTCDTNIPTDDADMNRKSLTISSAESSTSYTSSYSSEESSVDACSPVKNSDSSFCSEVFAHSDSGVSQVGHKETSSTKTHHEGNSGHDESPDEHEACASSTRDDEGSVLSDVTDLSCASEQTSCRTVCDEVSSSDYPFKHTFTDFPQCLREHLLLQNSTSADSSGVKTTQNQQAANFSDGLPLEGTGGESETATNVSFSDSYWRFLSLSTASDDTDVDDDIVTDVSKTQLAPKNGPEHEISSPSSSTDEIQSQSFSVTEEKASDHQEEWERSLDYVSFSELMNTNEPPDQTCSLNVSDDLETLSSDITSLGNTSESTEAYFTDLKPGTQGNALGQQSFSDPTPFVHSPAEPFIYSRDMMQFFLQIREEYADVAEENQHLDVPGSREGYKEQVNQLSQDLVSGKDSNDRQSTEENTACVTSQIMRIDTVVASTLSENNTQTLQSQTNSLRTNCESTLSVDQSQTSPSSKCNSQHLGFGLGTRTANPLERLSPIESLQACPTVQHSPTGWAGDVKAMDDNSKDQLSTPVMEESPELRHDDLFERYNSSLSAIDEDNQLKPPASGLYSSDVGANHELSLKADQKTHEQDYPSGIRSEPKKHNEGQVVFSSLSDVLTQKEAVNSEAAKQVGLECNSTDSFPTAQSFERSSNETFREKFQEVFPEYIVPVKLHSLDTEKGTTQTSYHAPLQLMFPRSSYSLHELKVFEHERKKMAGEVPDGKKRWPGTRENPGQESTFGLQEMADRFLQMKSPKINSMEGYKNRHLQLHYIERYLNEIRSKLHDPKKDQKSGHNFSQSNKTSLHKASTLSSLGHSKPCQWYDHGPVHSQRGDAKEVKAPLYSAIQQRTHFLGEQRYNVNPHFVHQKTAKVTHKADIGCFPGSHAREGEHAYGAVTSGRDSLYPIADYRQLHKRHARRAAHPCDQVVHLNNKAFSRSHCAEAPKAPADPIVWGRLPKHGGSELLYAHDPRLCVLTDRARAGAVAAGTERNGQLLKYKSPWCAHDPTSAVDARLLDNFESDNLRKHIYSESSSAVPQTSFSPGHKRMAYTNKFQTDIEHSDNLTGSDTSSTLPSRFSTEGSETIRPTTESSQQSSIKAGTSEREMYGTNGRDRIPVDMRSSHENTAPGRDFDERDRYQGNHQIWTLADNAQASQRYAAKMASANFTSGSDAYAAQQFYLREACAHSAPKAMDSSGRPGVGYCPFRHCVPSSSDLLMAENECVYYQHESAKFDSSLRSTPVFLSSTDNSSFHSSPEPSHDVNPLAKSTPPPPLKGKAPKVLRLWDASFEATESALAFTPPSDTHFTPVKARADQECKLDGSVETSRKCEAKANTGLFSMKKTENDTNVAVQSLSEAFERFLSSDVDSRLHGCESDAECCWGQEEIRRYLKQRQADSPFSLHKPGEKPRSILERLWIDTEDHRLTCNQAEGHGTGYHDSLLKLTSDFSCSQSADWESENGLKPLTSAFDRFLDLSSEDIYESSAAEPAKPDHHGSWARSPEQQESSESDWRQETHLYDMDDVIRVVLEMGVIYPESRSEFEVPVLPDNLQFDVHKQFPRTPTNSTFRRSSTETDDCCLISSSLDKTCPSSSNNNHHTTPRRRNTPVYVCDLPLKNQCHGKTCLQKPNVDTFQANIEKDQSSSNNECNNSPVPKSHQKSKRHQRPKVASNKRGKSAGGSTLSSRQSSSGSSSALRRSNSLPPKKPDTDHAGRKKSGLSQQASHLGQTCLPERKPSTPHGALCNAATEDFRFASYDCQHFDTRQSCCHKVAMPFLLPWNNSTQFRFYNPVYCMQPQVQNPPLGFYPPFFPPQPCPHGCLCKHFTGPHHANPNVQPMPSCIWPEMQQNWVVSDQNFVSSDLSSREFENSPTELDNNDLRNQHAYIGTVDALDRSLVPTLQDLGIVQVLLSDGQEEAKNALKPSNGLPDLHDHGSSETASRHGIYTKNMKSRRTKKASRYSKKGKEEGHPRHQKSKCPHSGEDTESREAASDRSASVLRKREKCTSRTLQCGGGQITADSGSEKSDREICYVTVPVDIRVRLEKAAKWISTQLFVCPSVHLLTPRDAHVFSIQQNLHLTLQIMALND
ncbi:hypothetical protein ACOMHN_001463 [Nucella lapillus]